MMLTTVVVRVELCPPQNAKEMLALGNINNSKKKYKEYLADQHTFRSTGSNMQQAYINGVVGSTLFQQKEGCMELGPQSTHAPASFC